MIKELREIKKYGLGILGRYLEKSYLRKSPKEAREDIGKITTILYETPMIEILKSPKKIADKQLEKIGDYLETKYKSLIKESE
ncbi:MAG: hypothetical protein QMD14_01860 [Candidatus Aenigmarchaeota archaeon]|nr:hypothetical protein [Candidatus Aenigmarchaeota archaeon]